MRSPNLQHPKWGLSSAGRAIALHAIGQRFDPASLHHSSCPPEAGGWTIERHETKFSWDAGIVRHLLLESSMEHPASRNAH